MIRQNRETKQIDAEAPGKLLEQLFDPDLTVVVILASYFIGSQQKAPRLVRRLFWIGNTQAATDLSSQIILNLGVSRNRFDFASGRVCPQGV